MKLNKDFQVQYEYIERADAQERIAVAFDMVFNEIEKLLQEEKLKGKEKYGKTTSIH